MDTDKIEELQRSIDKVQARIDAAKLTLESLLRGRREPVLRFSFVDRPAARKRARQARGTAP